MRKHYLDYLRVVAMVAVIAIHVTAYYYVRINEIGRLDWWLANLLNAVSRFSVPLFVMISGAVLLGKNLNTREFYEKRLKRLLPAIIVWNMFYVGFSLYRGMGIDELIWLLRGGLLINGGAAVHLWYLPMFFSLMLLVPFIDKILTGNALSAKDAGGLYYVVLVLFVWNGISSVADSLFAVKVEWFRDVPWFIVYFVGGHIIDRHGQIFPLSNTQSIFCMLSLVLFGAGLNYYLANYSGILKDGLILGNAGPIVFVVTILLFHLARVNSHRFKTTAIITRLSETSFGIYLIHPVFIYLLRNVCPSYNSHALIYIPLTICLTLAMSYLVIRNLRRFSCMRVLC